MQIKNIFYILVVIIFVFLGFILIKNNSCVWRPCPLEEARPPHQIQYVKIAGKILKVELALTQQEQERGLSGRKELKEDEGMLFVFNHIEQYSFWMKDMNFPIDIIWLSEDLRVVYIKKNAQPESYPETFFPNQNAKYVLEVLAQFSEKNNLKEGDKVEFLSP